jgi:hypothetical protein
MKIKDIKNLISEANSYDQVGNYKKADQIDRIIRLATGEKYTDPSGVLWVNIGIPQDFGLMGTGFVWERQDTKGRQILPSGTNPNSVGEPSKIPAAAPRETVNTQETVKEPESAGDKLYSLYEAMTRS